MIKQSWNYPVLNDNTVDTSIVEEEVETKVGEATESIKFYKASVRPINNYYVGKNVVGPFIGFGVSQQAALISALNNLASSAKG